MPKPRHTEPTDPTAETNLACFYCPATVYRQCHQRVDGGQACLCENPYGCIGVKAALLYYAAEHDGTFTVRDIVSAYGDIAERAVHRCVMQLSHLGIVKAQYIRGTVAKRYHVTLYPT